VAALFAAGVFTRDAGDTARMHRLIQAVALDHLAEPDREQHITKAVELMVELFPYDTQPDQWPQCAQLLAHAQTLIDHARAVEAKRIRRQDAGQDPKLPRLVTSVGIYLHSRGLDSRLARQMHEQALFMYQQLYEGDHPDMAHCLVWLAIDLREAGEHERARDVDEQALATRQRLYRGDQSDVAMSLNSLAIDLRQLGQHERSRELAERALAMRQRLYQGDHPEVAISLSNVAVGLREIEEYRRARELDEQALAMRQRLYRGDHRNVAMSLNNVSRPWRCGSGCTNAITLTWL